MCFFESIDKEYFTKLWKKVGKAIGNFDMISEGARIAIGISGGKDSLTLAIALKRLQNIAPVRFHLEGFCVNPGIKDFYEKGKQLFAFMEKLDIPLNIIDSEIIKIVFEDKKVKNPCFMCSRLRRGILYNKLKEKKFDTLALGHHMDDHAETFLLNVLFSGSSREMPPCYFSKQHRIKVIRPLVYVSEKDIIEFTDKEKIPITHFSCGISKETVLQRHRLKAILNDLEKDFPEVKNSVLGASLAANQKQDLGRKKRYAKKKR